jgi:hypothetical protein
VSVKLLCLDAKTRRKLATEFFLEDCNSAVTKKFKSEDEFLKTIAVSNKEALNEHFGGADKCETSLVMPLYFWIVDEEVAVFSLRRFPKAGAVEEWGFQTRDGPLVEALKGIFDQYRMMSARYVLAESRV